MYLIYDIDLVFSCLRRETYLLYQRPDIIYRVVGRSIQFVDIEGTSFIEGGTGMTLITRFPIRLQVFTVDCFGQYTGTGCFTHTSRTAEQEGMCQLVVTDRIFKGGSNM